MADNREALFARTLKALNSQFKSWVEEQHAEHLGELWSDGVESYLDHAKKLLEDFKDVIDARVGVNGSLKQPDGSKAGLAGTSTTPSGGLFSLSSSTPAFGAGASTPAFGSGTGAPMFGGGASGAGAPAFGGGGAAGLFGSSAPGAASSFGMPGSSGAAFSFGPAGGGVPAGGGGASGAAVNEAEEEEQEEDKEDTVAQIQESTDTEFLFKERAQMKELSVKEDGSKAWVDKGKGTASLRMPQGGQGKAYCVFTADSGRVLLNAGLNAKQQFSVSGKGKRMAMSTYLEADEHGKPNLRTVAFTFADETVSERFVSVAKGKQ